MLKSLHLKNVGPAPEMLLDLAPRLNLLTGDNGLGKSFVLDIAWWALTRTWAQNPAWPTRNGSGAAEITYEVQGTSKLVKHVSSFDLRKQKWQSRQARPPKPGIVVYARVDGSFSLWDPARNYWRDEDADRPPAFHFSDDELWNGLPGPEAGQVLCNGIIRDWVSWQERNAPEFAMLRRVLEKLSPPGAEVLRPGEPVRVHLNDVRRVPTLEMPYGRVPLLHASAGVRRIVALSYLLVWGWAEHLQASQLIGASPDRRMVFLIDEIEAHLHPRWQRSILPAVLSVGEILVDSTAEVQLLTVTHSPLVVASTEPLFDPALDALFLFDLVGDRASVRRDEWRRRGDVCNWLTSDVFDLEEARSLPAETVLTRAKELMRRDQPTVEEVRELQGAMAEVLPDTDPAWVRWRAALERKGIEV